MNRHEQKPLYATESLCLIAAVIVAAAGLGAVGFTRPGDHRSSAATLATPRLPPLLDGHARDNEGGQGVGPLGRYERGAKERTSENAVKRKFAESPFHALR